jgi:hypothetical protein
MDNPYQTPIDAVESSKREYDPLRFPAIGCLAGGLLGAIIGVAHLAFSIYLLRLMQQAENYEAVEQARKMAIQTWWFIGLSLLAIVTAVCIFWRQARWLVILSSIVGVATCLPAPLAVVVIMRLWRKDVWNSFL